MINLNETKATVKEKTITVNFTNEMMSFGNKAIEVIGRNSTKVFQPVLSADVFNKQGSLTQRTYVSGIFRLVIKVN